MSTFHVVIRCFVLALLLAACAHAPQTQSTRLLQAIDLNQQGEKAFRHHEYQIAIENFQASLLLNESLENPDGIAINRINLAKSYQAIDHLDEAHHMVDQLLQDSVLHFPDIYLAAAATQKSLLLLSRNEIAEAVNWIDKAANWCKPCSMLGTIYNVRSNIALRSNDAVAAAHWAELALKENKGSSQIEYANSLRLLARVKLSGNDAQAALPLLEEALALDKTLGLPEKIAYDLKIMADAYLVLGNANAASNYLERARRVSGILLKTE